MLARLRKFLSSQTIFKNLHKRKRVEGEFPDGPGARTRHFHCRGPSSIPGQETKSSQEKKKRIYKCLKVSWTNKLLFPIYKPIK